MFNGRRGSRALNLAFDTVTGFTRDYIAVRVEGDSSTSQSLGSSNSIYEIYWFKCGWVELRIGNWTADGGISGVYRSTGTGYSFTSPASGNSYVFSNSYYYSSNNIPLYETNYVYEGGKIVQKTNVNDRYPMGGAAPAASWPPSGWTSIWNSSSDDTSTTVGYYYPYVWGFNSNLYFSSGLSIGSNFYITYSQGYSIYSGLSTSNPADNKIMIDATDRSFQRIAYKVGAK